MVAPVNLLLFGPPMATYDLVIWITEFTIEHLPCWQNLWQTIQDNKAAREENNPPTVVNFTPAATASNPAPTSLICCYYPVSQFGDAGNSSPWLMACQTYDGTAWQQPVYLDNTSPAGTASAAVLNNTVYLFFQYQQPPAGTSGGTPEGWLYLTTSTDGVTFGSPANVFGGTTQVMQANPAAALFNGALYVFYQGIGTNSAMMCYTSSTDGQTWSANALVPSAGTAPGSSSSYMSVTNSPSAAVFTPSGGEQGLYVFHQNSNGELWYNVMNTSGSWAGDTQIPNITLGIMPTAFVYQDTLYVVVSPGGGALFYIASTDGSTWSVPVQVSQVGLLTSPSCAVMDNTLYCLMGPDSTGQVWCATAQAGNGGGLMYRVNGAFCSNGNFCGTAVFNNTLYCFMQPASPDFSMSGTPQSSGLNTIYDGSGAGNGALWYVTCDGNGWSTPSAVAASAVMSYSPSPVVFNDNLYVFANGPGGNGAIMYTRLRSDGNSWTGAEQVVGATCSYTPWPVVYNDQLWVVYQGADQAASMWYIVGTYQSGVDAPLLWSEDIQVPGSVDGCGNVVPPVAVVFNNNLYLFYIGTDWTIRYVQYTGSDSTANTWGVVQQLDCTILMGENHSLNGQTTGNMTPVVYDDENGTPTLAIFFCGYDTQQLYYMTTTDPSSQDNWSATMQFGLTLPSSSPPSGLGAAANLGIAVIAQNPLWAG